jgi:hypothetical protein
MKIRNGFVSNSSSSSFIVAVPDRIRTLDDVKERFNIDRSVYAKRILQQIKEQEGFLYCKPDGNKCSVCEKRYQCYTQGSMTLYQYMHQEDELEEWVQRVDEGSFGGSVNEFMKQHETCTFYTLIFRDSDSGGDSIDTEMRDRCGLIMQNLHYMEVT